MRALVLGGAGRIGNAFVRALLDRDVRVKVVGRRADRAENLEGLELDYVSGDVNHWNEIDAWVEGQDLVIDAAAPYAHWLFQRAPPNEALAQAVRRMEVISDSVRRRGCRLVFVSSPTAGRQQRDMMTRAQSYALRMLHPYFEMKLRMERVVTHAMRHHLQALIVAPSFCIGPWDVGDPNQSLIPMIVNGEIRASVAHSMNVLDVRDVAALTLEAVRREYFGERLAIVGHNCTLDVLIDAVCANTGATRPRWHVDPSIAAASAYAYELAMSAGLRAPAYPSVGPLLMLEQSWGFPTTRQSSLGVRLRPLSRTIADAIDWYARHGAFKRPVAKPRSASQASAP